MDWIEEHCGCRKNKRQSTLERCDTSCRRPFLQDGTWRDRTGRDL